MKKFVVVMLTMTSAISAVHAFGLLLLFSPIK